MAEHHFKFEIEGKSNIYTEDELLDLLYSFLKSRAEPYAVRKIQ